MSWRSPLLTILRNAEALNVGALGNMTPKQNEATATILSAVKREFTLLNAHLDLNRIEQGAEQFKYQDYDLVSLVREEVHAHEQEAMRKKVRLQTSLTQKKANVRIDVNRFRIAINPLMDNAIKFSSEDGIVLIRARVGIDSVEIQITDQGPGMQSDEIEHLLNLRPNESKQFSPRIRGSGLGLSMAKRIIEMHNGKLWIESDGKNGTTVIFRLPIK